jgi:hypothetical protein
MVDEAELETNSILLKTKQLADLRNMVIIILIVVGVGALAALMTAYMQNGISNQLTANNALLGGLNQTIGTLQNRTIINPIN